MAAHPSEGWRPWVAAGLITVLQVIGVYAAASVGGCMPKPSPKKAEKPAEYGDWEKTQIAATRWRNQRTNP